MRLRASPSAGSALSMIGAVLIAASLAMTWYHADRATASQLSGWQVFTNLRVWLLVAAVLTLCAALLPQGRGAVTVRCVLGILAGAPVLRRIVSPPHASVPLHDRVGVYVALAGAVAIVVGGVFSAGRRVARAYGWDIPGAGSARGLPRPSAPPPPGAGGAQATTREEIVDAQVVE